MKFNERLKELRIEKGLTQDELGGLIGCSRSTIANYETGNRTPDIFVLDKLSNLFNVSTDFLIGRTDVKKSNIIKLHNKNTFVLFYDANTGAIVNCSQNAPNFYGYSKKQLLKMHLWDINIGSKENIMHKITHQILNDTGSVIGQHKIADGSIKEVEIFRWLINFNNKEVIYSIIHTVTESEDKIRKLAFPLITVLINLANNNIIFRENHSNKVATIAEYIAQKIDFDSNRIFNLKSIALLHDIGMSKIPRSIINKTGQLTNQEYNLVKEHVMIGYNLLKKTNMNENLLKVLLQHHERLDGSGYPNQMKENEIMLDARLLAIADVLEAMTNKRVYREAYNINDVIYYFEKNKGKLYDKRITEVCLDLLSKKNFQDLLKHNL